VERRDQQDLQQLEHEQQQPVGSKTVAVNQGNPMLVNEIVVVVAVGACAFDLTTRRIPNLLTLGAALVAIVFHASTGGVSSLLAAVGGWLLGIALFFPFFALKGLGGGDVKLLGAFGAWLGPLAVFHVGLYSAMAGGVLGLLVALRAGYVVRALKNLEFLGTYWSTVGLQPVEGMTLDAPNTPRLAYAVPMLAGLLVTLWLQ
jgi:prepilin peptidase CpaA